MDNKRQFILNLFASLISFAANLGIGFLMTPFIVQQIGAEAYGFVGLANTMINYATLFTLALNSVSGALSQSRTTKETSRLLTNISHRHYHRILSLLQY